MSRSTDPGSAFGVFTGVFALTALPFGVAMGTIYGGEHMTRVSVHFDGPTVTFVGPRWMVRKIAARM